MNTIRRVSSNEIKRAVTPGGQLEVAPVGTHPILRAAWPFAKKWARKFSGETLRDRADQFMKALVKNFR